jgi:hypothetical protein
MTLTDMTQATQDAAHKNYDLAVSQWVAGGPNEDHLAIARTLLALAQDAHWRAIEEEMEAAMAA